MQKKNKPVDFEIMNVYCKDKKNNLLHKNINIIIPSSVFRFSSSIFLWKNKKK